MANLWDPEVDQLPEAKERTEMVNGKLVVIKTIKLPKAQGKIKQRAYGSFDGKPAEQKK